MDTAEKTGHPEIATMRQHGVQSASKPAVPNPVRELKQTVSDIRQEAQNQPERTRQTRKRMQSIANRLNRMPAINSTIVVAVLIATVAFAAILTVPGQYVDDPDDIPPGHSLEEANIAPKPAFIIFFVFDSIALFISLAVVVVQTSVAVTANEAKKQMMAIINKLLWMACVLVSVAFLALSFVIVGKKETWLAVGVTILGAATIGTTCYCAIRHRIEVSNSRSIRRSSRGRRLRPMSETQNCEDENIFPI